MRFNTETLKYTLGQTIYWLDEKGLKQKGEILNVHYEKIEILFNQQIIYISFDQVVF
jgi:hypothetical protein